MAKTYFRNFDGVLRPIIFSCILFFNPSICLISPSVIYKPPCKRIDQLPRKAGKRKPFP